jgi:lipopolysaccharide export system permease protein
MSPTGGVEDLPSLFRILDRYVLREVATTWVAVTAVLLAILVSNQLARILGLAAANGLPQDVVLSLIWLTSLQYLTLLMPIGMLLAIMMALGRLYHDSEMAAVRACGTGPERLYLPVMLLAATVAIGLAWLAFVVAPTAFGMADSMRREALRNAQFGRLEAGKFRTFANGTAVFYAERADEAGVLYNVFLERTVGERVEVATAVRAVHRIEDAGRLHVIVLYDGVRYEGTPGEANFRELRFTEHGIPVRIPGPDDRKLRSEAKSMAALLASDVPRDVSELQWRISLPLMVIVLSLLAVPLAALRPRQGRYARVAVAIFVYFGYSNLISAARVWIEKGQIDPRIGVWWVHLLVVLLALLLLNRQSPLPAIFSRSAA